MHEDVGCHAFSLYCLSIVHGLAIVATISFLIRVLQIVSFLTTVRRQTLNAKRTTKKGACRFVRQPLLLFGLMENINKYRDDRCVDRVND